MATDKTEIAAQPFGGWDFDIFKDNKVLYLNLIRR